MKVIEGSVTAAKGFKAIGAAVGIKKEVKDRGDAITGVQNAINTEKGRIDTLEQKTIPGINAKVNTL